MDETEKMKALKKAYAEIILNTAKEAAARIMVSERRAHQLNHDLSCTKDEALRLLLRLKHTMDSKVNEAEVRSLDQQRKIEELEAQLQEAEDIVSGLREELTEAHTKLEKIENNQLYRHHFMVEKAVYEEENIECQNKPFEALSASEAKQIRYGTNGCLVAVNNLVANGYSGEPDVPSIIMRNKKPELYRNGCTQRIRACGGNHLRGHFTLAGRQDHLKNVEAIQKDEQGEKICMGAPVVAEITCVEQEIPAVVSMTCVEQEKPVESNEVKDEDNIVLMQTLKSLRKKRNRAIGHIRSNASTVNPVSPVAKETCFTLSDSQAVLPCSRRMHESDNEDMSAQPYLPSATPSDVSKIGAPEYLLGFKSDDKLNDDSEVDVNKDKEVASNLAVTTQQSGGDIAYHSGSQTELEMKNLSMEKLDVQQLEACDRFSSPSPKDWILKYTFQRKRKKESVVSEDSYSVHQENSLRRKKSNKQVSDLEPGNSCAMAEYSPDSRRVAQVAHQLISLSEKKVWK